MANSRDNLLDNTKPATSTCKIYQQLNIDVASGLFSGAISAGLFNPWDRALYLSVKSNRPFLHIKNFVSPYHGFSQSVFQRAFLGGIYYILQAELNAYLLPMLHRDLKMSHASSNFCIGLLTGCVSGMLTNGISSVKYHTWGNEHYSFRSSVQEMWRNGGLTPFIKGTKATATRDMVFGSAYEVLRYSFRDACMKHQSNYLLHEPYISFISNSFAAGIATMLSSPFNYVRNIQYATPPDRRSPSMTEVLRDVWLTSSQHANTTFGRARFFQRNFRIGWGTARVAVGMAVGQKIFDLTRSGMSERYLDGSSKTNRLTG